MLGFIGAIYFHGAMMVGALIFILIVFLRTLKNLYKSLKNYKIGINNLILLSILIFAFTMYFSNKISVPYLGTFQKSTDISDLQQKTKIATRGTASWPEFTNKFSN